MYNTYEPYNIVLDVRSKIDKNSIKTKRSQVITRLESVFFYVKYSCSLCSQY